MPMTASRASSCGLASMNSKERVKESLRRLFEGHPVLRAVGLSFGGIPNEGDSVQFIQLVHER
jgi:hypothetical protein